MSPGRGAVVTDIVLVEKDTDFLFLDTQARKILAANPADRRTRSARLRTMGNWWK